jgi:hypothetical protein
MKASAHNLIVQTETVMYRRGWMFMYVWAMRVGAGARP